MSCHSFVSTLEQGAQFCQAPSKFVNQPSTPPMKHSFTIPLWQRKILLVLGVVTLSSCSMPPGQAWRMIQRDGLLNYWGYSAGSPALYGSRASGQMSSTRQSLAYRPPYSRYGESWQSYRSTPSISRSYSSNRYTAPSAPRLSYSAPSTPSPRYSEPKPSSSKPKVAASSSRPKPRNDAAPAPKVSSKPAPSKPSPSVAEQKKPSSPSGKPSELPFGSVVPGRPNMVNSPYAGKSQLVDVAGMSAGQTVKCPYSGKLFKVPPTQQAANKVQSKLEAPNENSPPKSDSSEAKGDKKP